MGEPKKWEQSALLKRAAEGDEAAKSQLVEANLGLVWSVVKKFAGRGYEADDLFQIGCMGLLKAIEKFDLSFEVRFSTYAVPMIIGEIKRFLRDDGPLKVSRSIKELAMKARSVSETLQKQTGEEASIHQIANQLGKSSEDIVFALEAVQTPDSLYAGENDDDSIPLIDKTALREGETDIIDKIALREAIHKLEPRERQIIMFRYFGDKTQAQVAALLGISQVQVSRLEKKILATMRGELSEIL